MNPTRAALLDFLVGMGAQICGFPIWKAGMASWWAKSWWSTRDSRGGTIEGGLTAALIDEIPVLAVLGAATSERA